MSGQLSARAAGSFKKDTVDLAPESIEGAGGVFSQKKSDTVFRLRVASRGWDSSF